MPTIATPSKAFIPFLIGMMLLTGVCNTLITKYQVGSYPYSHPVQTLQTLIYNLQDNQCVRNCQDPDASKHQKFEQPVWQTAQMFVGEMGCWLVLVLSKLFSRMTNKNNIEEYEPLLAEDDRDDSGEEAAGDPSGSVNAANPATTNEHFASSTEIRELTGWRTLLLAMPAICDIIGTTLMNTGLLFVVASVFPHLAYTVHSRFDS